MLLKNFRRIWRAMLLKFFGICGALCCSIFSASLACYVAEIFRCLRRVALLKLFGVCGALRGREARLLLHDRGRLLLVRVLLQLAQLPDWGQGVAHHELSMRRTELNVTLFPLKLTKALRASALSQNGLIRQFLRCSKNIKGFSQKVPES